MELLWEYALPQDDRLDQTDLEAPILDRLEAIARSYTEAGNFARWAISFAASGAWRPHRHLAWGGASPTGCSRSRCGAVAQGGP